jgi:predicted MPP superfamily phosphohydrolase
MWQFLLVLLPAAALLIVAYAFLVEPYRIEVTHTSVEAPLAMPLRIAHLSDLHTSGFGRRERQLVLLLEAEQPDVILITGDTLDRSSDYEKIRPVLSLLRAPLGVFLVRGNSELYSARRDEEAFYSQLGIQFLTNRARPLRPDIWLVGLDGESDEPPKLDTALCAVPPDAYVIAAFHLPAYFDKVAGHVHLAFAGHTHGGQIRVPFAAASQLPRGSGRYVEGWYTERGSKMYVSRGIGTSFLPIRFRCAPELPIITVGPSSVRPSANDVVSAVSNDWQVGSRSS